MKFYTFNQNNSGGYFVKNAEYGINEIVIIEAESFDEAWNKLNDIGENVPGFDISCSCCGERWSDYGHDEDGTENPEIYGKSVYEREQYIIACEKSCYIHFFNGKKEHAIFKSKS